MLSEAACTSTLPCARHVDAAKSNILEQPVVQTTQCSSKSAPDRPAGSIKAHRPEHFHERASSMDLCVIASDVPMRPSPHAS